MHCSEATPGRMEEVSVAHYGTRHGRQSTLNEAVSHSLRFHKALLSQMKPQLISLACEYTPRVAIWSEAAWPPRGIPTLPMVPTGYIVMPDSETARAGVAMLSDDIANSFYFKKQYIAHAEASPCVSHFGLMDFGCTDHQ